MRITNLAHERHCERNVVERGSLTLLMYIRISILKQ